MTNILQASEPAMEWLLRITAQSAVLVVLILCVQTLGRERITPRWRHALWLLLVLRLALPVQLPNPLSLFNLVQPRPNDAFAGIAEPPAASISRASETPATQTSAARAEATQTAPLTAAAATIGAAASMPENQQGEATGTAWGWKTWLSLLWLAGAAVLVLRIVVQNVLFFRKLRSAPTMTATEAWQTLEDCRKQMGLHQRLVLVESETIHSPALYGFLRLHLLLPRNTLATLTTEELRFVFLHELAHVKRRDMLLNWAVIVLQVVHWFNPLVWVGFRRMAADRELAADAMALSHLQPRENSAYGNAILKLLRTLLHPAPLPGLVGILETNSQMKRRINMIATFKKTDRWPVLAVLAFVGIALVAFTDPSSGSERRPLKLSGKPAADLAVLRVWNCVYGELSMPGGTSPDGQYLCFTDPLLGGLAVRDLIKGKNQHVVKATESWKQFVTGSVMSPDASQIAYGWYQKAGPVQLRVVGRDGKKDRLLYENPEVVYAGPCCWSPDGLSVVADFQVKGGAASSNQLVLVSVRDGSVRLIKAFEWDFPGGVCQDPSGRFLVYHVRRSSASPEREIRLIDLRNGEDTVVMGGPSDNACLGWSPDGNRLLFTSNRRSTIDCWVQRMEDGKPQGNPELLKPDLGKVNPLGITRAGGLYFSTSSDSSEIQVARLDATSANFVSEPTPLVRKFRGHETQPHWSPDGNRLAYVSQEVLYVRSMDTGAEREYAPRIGGFFAPAWSADGKSIRVTTSHVNEQPGTFRVDLATGEAQRLDHHGFFVFPAADETVGFRRVMQSPQQILSRNLSTGEEKLLYKLPERERFGGGWMLSPDAKYLAFGTAREEGKGWRSMMNCIPASGGEARVLMSSANRFSCFAWFPDSRHALVRNGNELCLLSLDGQAPRTMKAPSIDASNFSIHPGGQKVAFAATTTSKSEVWLMENAVPVLEKQAAAAR